MMCVCYFMSIRRKIESVPLSLSMFSMFRISANQSEIIPSIFDKCFFVACIPWLYGMVWNCVYEYWNLNVAARDMTLSIIYISHRQVVKKA